jgi:glycyl-tRNA synthetase
MKNGLNFQEIILRLLNYWQEKGCLVQQPYNVQIGAGTMNPATVLRVLGPEPWNVVYVEPSIRPDDGRFGDNPNRMQMHHQLQVILKPDPGNPQELYLESLEAIGIDPRRTTFASSKTIGKAPRWVPGASAGKSGWMGRKLPSLPTFSRPAGMELDPVSVELTYGLDRIALALAGVDSVWELEYGAGISYQDVLLQSEIEHCRYYFEVADVEGLKTTYDIYENEAKRCLEAGLIIPAHDYNLKCSHLFNVLDTRGAIGVTERAHYFHRMRTLARQVSEQYLEQRQRLEFPLLEEQIKDEPAESRTLQFAQIETPQTFLLEIGSEELPVDDVTSGVTQLQSLVPQLLRDLRLTHGLVEVFGTPRRLVVLVHNLEGRQADLETEVKGPPADRAFTADGRPTKAAIGFARGKGVDVADLRISWKKGINGT